MKRNKEMNRASEEKKYKRPYREIMEELRITSKAKDFRRLHKELKRDYKDSVPIEYRYPNLPIIISVIALVASIVSLLATS